MKNNIRLADFNRWNKIKKNIAIKNRYPHCCKGEVWWCSIGKNIGVEQGCRKDSFSRPVLVMRVFNQDMFWGIPITSTDDDGKKENSRFYYKINNVDRLKGFCALSQLRLFDNKRLSRKIAKLNRINMNFIKEEIISLL